MRKLDLLLISVLVMTVIADQCMHDCRADCRAQGMTNEPVIERICRFKCDDYEVKRSLKGPTKNSLKRVRLGAYLALQKRLSSHANDKFGGFLKIANYFIVNSTTKRHSVGKVQRKILKRVPRKQKLGFPNLKDIPVVRWLMEHKREHSLKQAPKYRE